MIMVLRQLSIYLFALLVPMLALGASDTRPTDLLKQRNEQVERLLRQNPAKDSPEEKKQKDQIKQLAGEILDYQELAKLSLADHWNPLLPKQREEFVAAFREMLEKNYVKQIKNSLDYQVSYSDEQITADKARVKTIVKVKTQGKTTDAEIEYKMHKVGGTWMVWDIITDEVSLVRNYKTQFHKIITEQSYDKLLEKIRSRLKEGN